MFYFDGLSVKISKIQFLEHTLSNSFHFRRERNSSTVTAVRCTCITTTGKMVGRNVCFQINLDDPVT